MDIQSPWHTLVHGDDSVTHKHKTIRSSQNILQHAQNVEKIIHYKLQNKHMSYNNNNNHLTAVCRDNAGRLVPEETFTCSHPSWSTYFLTHLSPFATVHVLDSPLEQPLSRSSGLPLVLESPTPICVFTIHLRWLYDEYN